MGDAGPVCLADKNYIKYILGLLNSKYVSELLPIINPTINCSTGVINQIPLKLSGNDKEVVDEKVGTNILLSKVDWDSFETSWDFIRHPLVRGAVTVVEAYVAWKAECNDRFNKLKANEEELNRIFIDIYGLQDELTPEVEDKDVTVYRIIDQPDENERKMAYVLSMKDEIVSLLSYIVGCMLGRYSPYVDGLLYAGGEWIGTRSLPASRRACAPAISMMNPWACSCLTRTPLCP